MELETKIEALLFARGEPVERSFLGSFLKENGQNVEAALQRLKGTLAMRGVALVDNGNSVALATSPHVSTLIEKLRKAELERELSKAALETLSIVLYAGPVPRATIDFIRGVNSQFILRSLLVRGLVERAVDEADERRMLYRPTIEFLSHLGIRTASELPGYAEFLAKLEGSAARMNVGEETMEPAS